MRQSTSALQGYGVDVRGDSVGLLFAEDLGWRQVAPYLLRIERRNTRAVPLPVSLLELYDLKYAFLELFDTKNAPRERVTCKDMLQQRRNRMRTWVCFRR